MVVAYMYHLGGRLGIECRRRWLGGKWHSRTEEQKLGLSVVGQCEASREDEAFVAAAPLLLLAKRSIESRTLVEHAVGLGATAHLGAALNQYAHH